MGEAQAGTVAASERYRQARDTEDAAQRALWTARDELLAAAEQVQLPGSSQPAREYRGDGSRADVEALQSEPRRLKDQPQA